MEAEAGVPGTRSRDREWWLRTLAVFTSPTSTFAALRDPDPEDAAAREEPILALILLAGIAQFLAMPATEEGLFRLRDPDGLTIAVFVFVVGSLYGVATYWLGGGALRLGIRGAGGAGDYRLARHILAFALAPLVLSSLVLWPVRLAIYGTDLFESGGADESGAGYWVFEGLELALFGWAALLLLVGLRTVFAWPIVRALGALGLALLALVCLGLVFAIL
jgi:hypothetical protein